MFAYQCCMQHIYDVIKICLNQDTRTCSQVLWQSHVCTNRTQVSVNMLQVTAGDSVSFWLNMSCTFNNLTVCKPLSISACHILMFLLAVVMMDFILSRRDLQNITAASVAIVHQDLSWTCTGQFGMGCLLHVRYLCPVLIGLHVHVACTVLLKLGCLCIPSYSGSVHAAEKCQVFWDWVVGAFHIYAQHLNLLS